MQHPVKIIGQGFYVPEKALTNAELEGMVDTTDQWIVDRTGIRERRVAAPGQATSDLAREAARKALDSAGVSPRDLTHIVVATLTPDAYCPSTATKLQHQLGCREIMAMDVNAACSGFLYGLQTGRALAALQPGSTVLLVAAEVLSTRTNWTDRSTCVLFGDGAGAAVLSSDPAARGAAIEDMDLRADGQYWDLLTIRGGGSGRPYALGDVVDGDFFIQMAGREVFKLATRAMEGASRDMLAKHGLGVADVDVFISHQANLRIISYVGKKLGFTDEQVFVNVDRYGNTSAASVGIALAEARETGVIRDGHRVLLTTFGGGLTWGSALLRY
ncbi:MAG: beta-ketoacyl-ACP synthase III [Thermodesulfobacteriota bacterium]